MRESVQLVREWCLHDGRSRIAVRRSDLPNQIQKGISDDDHEARALGDSTQEAEQRNGNRINGAQRWQRARLIGGGKGRPRQGGAG
jgi:hypothetical protein